MQSIMFYFVISSALTYFNAKKVTPREHPGEHTGITLEPASELQTLMGVSPGAKIPVFPTRDHEGRKLGPHRCLFKSGALLDFSLYITEDEKFDFSKDSNSLVWNVESVHYNSSFSAPNPLNLSLPITEHMYQNGSVFAHVFFSKSGYPIDRGDDRYDDDSVAYSHFNLIRYRKKKIPKKTYKLLEQRPIEDESSSEDISNEDATAVALRAVEVAGPEDGLIVPYWVPSLDIAIVHEITENFGRNQIPSAVSQHMSFNSAGDFYPIIYHNDFFLMSKSLIEINQTISEVPLSVSISIMAFLRWHMQAQMEQSWKQQQAMGTGSERDTDMIREVLFDTNPWLLGLTFCVSLLHMLFDFLAFKNDVQFWRKKKSMAGMSVQSLGVNCFFQTVIFLYLMDNDTSWMILFSSGIGLCIEYWKLTKAFNISFTKRGQQHMPPSSPVVPVSDAEDDGDGSAPPMKITTLDSILGVPLPMIVSWKLSDTYTTSKTREYDAIATTHLLYAVVPLVFGYSIYSLLHISHKSFYSWFLGSLVGFVYAFGFVLMTPQLFINYKLKSVAHMPWKAMVYKSLNTFIDDLFAFVIKMPLMHRLACFRDDIIFFIYLYQRWVYTVDLTRVNEFGQGGEEGDAAVSSAPALVAGEINKKCASEDSVKADHQDEIAAANREKIQEEEEKPE